MSIKDKTALILDDDKELRIIVEKILTNVGINVVHASSVKEAISSIDTHHPHIIFSDLEMKPESGFDFLEQYHKKRPKACVPVLVLSGLEDKASIYKAMSLGAREYLTKPVKASLLIQKTRKLLRSEEFNVVEFELNQAPVVHAEVPATITAACEVGFQVSASVRLSRDSKITLGGPISKELGLSSPPQLKSAPRIIKAIGPGQFLNEIRFVGIAHEMSTKMRALLKRWS